MPLPGTRAPALEGVTARLPWQSPQATGDETAGEPLYRRVFGIFGGNGLTRLFDAALRRVAGREGSIPSAP